MDNFGPHSRDCSRTESWSRRAVLAGGSATILASAGISSAADDDTRQIQQLIERAGPGSTVTIPSGVWHVAGLVLSHQGVTVRGQSGAILRQARPDSHMITVAAPDVTISDLRLEGTASSARFAVFAIFTTPNQPAVRLAIRNCVFSGPNAALGFTSAIKLDEKSDGAHVSRCRFERLWGTESGFGYAILIGTADAARVERNIASAPAGRGRHFIYLSAGCRDCIVEGNQSEGFEFEAITIFARSDQRTSLRNRIANNIIRGAARRGSLDVGAIGLYANVAETTIVGNHVIGSLSTGIASNGTNARTMRGNRIVDNEIAGSGFFGIDVIAAAGATIDHNSISDSSLADPGVYSDIRLASDGVTPVTNAMVTNNRTGSGRLVRSAFQINQTEPTPRGTRLSGNSFAAGRVAAMELGHTMVSIATR